jgi:hypothetical protein
MKNTNPSEFRNPAEEVLNQLLALMQNVQQQSGSENLFYDNADLKCLFHLSDSTLYRMRRKKSIPYTCFGRKYFYPKAFFRTLFHERDQHSGKEG